MKIRLILPLATIFFLSSCAHTLPDLSPERKAHLRCRLELYCTRTEGSIIKAGAFKAIELYFGTDLKDGICEKFYAPWGFDYRKTAEERCGKDKPAKE